MIGFWLHRQTLSARQRNYVIDSGEPGRWIGGREEVQDRSIRTLNGAALADGVICAASRRCGALVRVPSVAEEAPAAAPRAGPFGPRRRVRTSTVSRGFARSKLYDYNPLRRRRWRGWSNCARRKAARTAAGLKSEIKREMQRLELVLR